MGLCTKRFFFLSICLLQMISVLERQVFHFLGFLWIPILVNFFEIVFIIFGFFGAYQYRPKYLIAYLLWHIFWLGWNVFMICLYLDIGELDHGKNKVLKLDPTSDSWWKKEGPGCKTKVNHEPTEYEGCLISYVLVEVAQAALQCIFALCNTIIGICLSRTFLEEDDTFNYEKPDGPNNILLHPMYVDSSDNLHTSNTFVNVPDNGYFLSRHRLVRADNIRDPQRSNSFNTIGLTNKKVALRPKSLCSDAYCDV